MELALIAFIVGTISLVAADLAYFVQRRRPISVSAEASSAVSRLFALSRAVKSWEKGHAEVHGERHVAG
jgi:hypothetical protein